ncbi:MAG TPA: alpha/beta hydrolase [Caulobacteraceae bacterium]|nr:alpha/beta hydrolase [Caulobacteraceae bacterium]
MARTTSAGGAEIEYETFGDAANETVLLINGLGSQMTRWPEDFCRRLTAHGLRVVRFDNRDVGKSTWFKAGDEYTVSDMAADGIAVLDAVGAARAHVVGMSMGGMIGQVLAADWPDRVLSFVSIMSNSGNPDLPPPDIAFLRQVAPDPAKDRKAYLDHAEKSAQHIASPGYPWPAGALRARAEAELERAYNPAGVARQMAAVGASGDRRSKLRTIKAPTVVLHGADDVLVPVEGGRDTAANILGAELRVIEGMGHDLPPALYDAFIDAILRAVQRAHAPA